MEDLIALFDEPEPDSDPPESPESKTDLLIPAKERGSKRKSLKPKKSSSNAQIAVDERVGGIHMVNRTISSSQLEDYLDEYDFHAAAQLGFYSHENLNTKVLLDSVDTTTTPVAGNTRIFTVGIVLQHSGSRLTASNGQAFAKLDLGTLRTGATISILLFGTAYRVHASSVVAGTVIGLLHPRLLPPKAGDRITFAANDADQVMVIAKSRDFGRCRGFCRGKNEKGMWVADAKPCRNVVDVSISRFCKEHQKKASQQTKNAFQELRNQTISHRQQRQCGENGRIMTLPKNMDTIRGVASVAQNNKAKNPTTRHNQFNGSVLVPQASSLFGRCHVPVPSRLITSGPRNRTPAEILAKQRQAAQQAAVAVKKTPLLNQVSKATKRKAIVPPQNAFAAAFGPTMDMEEEKLRNAQSDFADLANAEEYARSCQALTELEKLEAKKRPKEDSSKRLIQIWTCKTCQRDFRKEPTACYRRKHKIKLERTLRKDDSLSEKRQKRTNADAQSGGLILGQGLDWSIGSRFDH